MLTLHKKLVLISLLLYWPGIFILAHIPIPEVIYKARVSDKSLHFLIYLILAFLIWFVINPDRKVIWHKFVVWKIFFVICVYGVIDEWSQSYVGRTSDFFDFLFNLAGAFAGLILFSFLTFWPALLAVTGITIFLLTNLAKANIADLLPIISATFYLFAYAFFTLIWIRCLNSFLPLKVPRLKWLMATVSLPIVFLLIVKSFSVIAGSIFVIREMLFSVEGIG